MKFFLSFFFGLLGLGLISWLWWQNAIQPPASFTESKAFVISKGASAASIGKKLVKEGIIRNELAFKIYVQLTGRQKSIKAGFYKLPPKLTLPAVVKKLAQGPEGVWVVYPEGLRREESALVTIKTLGLQGKNAEKFWHDFLSLSQGKEGFLFPDTYLFSLYITPKQVIAEMTENFEKKWAQLSSDLTKSNLTQKEVIVLASIVERETRSDEERPIVAGILLKRLASSWPLQADATLQYILGTKRCSKLPLPEVLDCNWWTPPAGADKKLRSSYNTYLINTLPPAPIANPGLSSIKAVLQPQDSPYWFYLHDKNGNIHYARTIQEHNQNIRKYLD